MTKSFLVASSKYQLASMDSSADVFNNSKASDFCLQLLIANCELLSEVGGRSC